ncbi:sensor histidine kinase [Prauserella muralis]|uniref:histidine kinase n=1 Tax=Prauserella muralis TaxID=588067 RepID=A0A2V4AGR5_9PSEU|nr:histidine kinase [Prauserella muralis]PXY19108.1 histidine kinase [Prauserella muralis]
MIRRILGPVVDRSTYRRWTYLILGGALFVPYLLFGAIVVPSVVPMAAGVGAAVVIGGAAALAVLAATSVLPAVRALETAAVRELLGDPVPDAAGAAADGAARVRSGVLFAAHVLTGGVLSAVSLVLPVVFVLSLAVPFTGRFGVGAEGSTAFPQGWASAWLPAASLLAMLALFHAVSAAGALLTRLAVALLGLSPTDRIAALERRTERLAERNRLARELHDSVGHALSVVSLQAGAARRTLRRDPDTAEQALLAIEDSARAALDDLDHVLGLLREQTPERAPRAELTRLPSLVAATREAGMTVECDVRGDLAAVGPVVSREAYRIVQESLTNALRHAGKVPVTVAVHVSGGELALRVRNPLGAASGARRRSGGGSGLRGITERAELLGGRVRTGRQGEAWEVAVWLPTGRRGEGA